MFCLMMGLTILMFTLLMIFSHFFISIELYDLFLYSVLIFVWGYSEYHHRVIMSPLQFKTGVLSGKIQLLNEFKKNSKKKK